MILAVSLALLPIAFVAVMATLELHSWWRQLKHIRELPELGPEEVRA